MFLKKRVPFFLSTVLFCSIQSFSSDSKTYQQFSTRVFYHVDRIKNLLDQCERKIVYEFPVKEGKKLLEEINIIKNSIDHFKKLYQAYDISISALQEMYFFEHDLLSEVQSFLVKQKFEPHCDGRVFPDSVQELEKISKKVDEKIDELFLLFDNFVHKKTLRSKTSTGSSFLCSPCFKVTGFIAAGLFLFNHVTSYSKINDDYNSVALSKRNKLFRGCSVTPNNLYRLSPKMPRVLERKVRRWFERNKDVWKTVVRQDGPFRAYKKKDKKSRTLLMKKGANLCPGSQNFVFVFPEDSQWIVKISGPVNRASLQVANQNLPYGCVDLVNKKFLVSTCQTASRMFYLLKLKEAIKKYKLDKIETVQGYLWSPYCSCDDKKSVYIEKILKNHILLKDCSAKKLDEVLTFERVRQLLIAAKHAGLWDLTAENIAINKKNKKLVVLDTEQPNTTKPSQLFNKDKKRYKHNITCGAQSLYKTLAVRKLKARHHVVRFMEKDRDFLKKKKK